MSGLYIHIPYCKQKCIYCDFYSSPTHKPKDDFISSLKLEIERNKDFIPNDLKTIYFGGGTPSTLSPSEIDSIFDSISKNFSLQKLEEITFESNPEQLTKEYLDYLISSPINRLSIGVQSFDDIDLRILGRKHNSIQAINSILYAKAIGFNNISIDLMYNLPNMNLGKWRKNLEKSIELDIEHISAYSLSIEKGTILEKLIGKGRLSLPKEDIQLQEFNLAIDFLGENNIYQYEISNFSKLGYRSIHNSNYWNEIPYLGIGPSAHSYNLNQRKWNINNIDSYCYSIINNKEDYFELENLDEKQRYNEFIFLNLRKTQGINQNYIRDNFSEEFYFHFQKEVPKLVENKLLIFDKPYYKPTRRGLELNNNMALNLII